MYPCPCCGYIVFDDPPGSHEICPICFWEDDVVQLAFPDLDGGANKCSLMEGQQNYMQIGACEERVKDHVRLPQRAEKRDAEWRSLNVEIDQYLHWTVEQDQQRWKSTKDSQLPCLYYWLANYWLVPHSRGS